MRFLTEKEFVDGKIPESEHFQMALTQFEAEAILPFIGDAVIGAGSYGSVKRGDASPASDIDYLGVIRHPEHVWTIREATEHVWRDFGIELQTRVIDEDIARAGRHRLDASFLEHLSLSMERYGFHGKNPLSIISSNGVPVPVAAQTAIDFYACKLRDGLSNAPKSNEEELRFLQTILDKPFHAARCAIQVRFGTAAPPHVGKFEDTKQYIVRTFKTMEDLSDLFPFLNDLQAAGKDYVQALTHRREAGITQQSAPMIYRQLVGRVFDLAPSAYTFAKNLSLRAAKE